MKIAGDNQRTPEFGFYLDVTIHISDSHEKVVTASLFRVCGLPSLPAALFLEVELF